MELEDQITLSVPVTDLLVTHRAVEVAKDKMSKEFRKGKLVAASEMQFLQRENSLAQFVRVTSAPRKLASPRKSGGTQKSPRTEQKEQKKPQKKQEGKQEQPREPASEEQQQEEEPTSGDLVVTGEEPVESAKRVGLRFADGEEVFVLIGDWLAGVIVTGDADVEDGPYYLVYQIVCSMLLFTCF